MRGFLAVARREIEEKWFVFLAAAVASLVPFAVPIVRGLHGTAAMEVREWTALVGASTLAVGLATLLGATVIASDLAERRLGFYFSRPITGFALWAGKLGTAGFIALAAAAIVYAPTLAVNGGRVIVTDLPRQSPFLLVAGVAVIVLVMHAGNILLRPRSPLLAVDMAALIVLCLAVVYLAQLFAQAFAIQPLETAIDGLLAVTAVALLAGGLLAVTRGRSDSKAAHRTLSATLWGVVAAGVVAMAAYAGWVFSASPQNVTNIHSVEPALRGSWVVLVGEARGWEPTFLFDTATGRFRRTGESWREARISPDGTRAVWFEPSRQGGLFDAFTWRLDEPVSNPVRTNLSFSGIPDAFLSEHGERLATISAGVLSVWDLSTGASLGSARVGAERSYSPGSFVDLNRIRVRRIEIERPADHVGGAGLEGRLEIFEFDISTKRLATVVDIDGIKGMAALTNPTGDRLIVWERTRITLRDGHSGALIATLSERGQTKQAFARFVSDGRIVVAVTEGLHASRVLERARSVRIEVFTREGSLERTLAIPGRATIALGGEAAPGKLIVAAGGDSSDQKSRAVFLADLSSGEVRQVADRLFPVALTGWWSSGYHQPGPGEEATKLFIGSGGSLVHFDALTGERRVILGRDTR